MSHLSPFHPVLRDWFEKNLGNPTPVQAAAWPEIRAGKHTLIAAPTGSGKTLASFYAVIDGLVRDAHKGVLARETRVVYVSPLKALGNDIRRNLELPLAGIYDELVRAQMLPVKLAVAVRTGDTPAGEREEMLKKPPHILVTTPESLYLLLTSERGRKMLGTVRTLILDEIHALIGDKRGAHLALSVERLEALAGRPLQRIGLSATQKPVETVARFLVGNRAAPDGRPNCAIVDLGHRRKMDLTLEVPKSPLSAVMGNEVWEEIYARLVELAGRHKTTLIFVNTRRLAERLAKGLAERIGEERVSSHHGSMSKEHRLTAERRLKSGALQVLVATASMELGIDIGSVDLVVQISSPKRIAAFLQRVGRSGHSVGGTPKGILFPLTRDELVECAALLDSVRRGELDRLAIPEEPDDILCQQIVAETAGREWGADALYELFLNAYPYRNLKKEKFLSLVRMLAEGFTTRRGRRGAHLYFDSVNGWLRPRRGARLTALTNGGAIPDMFDYEVVLQPEGITVGTLNEDFAIESLPGDIFTLGTHSWQLLRVEGLKVMVQDATGKPATVPFWLGEGASRSAELSQSVDRLRQMVDRLLEEAPLPNTVPVSPDHPAMRWLVGEVGICSAAAEQILLYLWMGKTGLGAMPTRETLVMERFFDEAGDTHLVIHSPYGSRLNRAWGLALRKKFCRKFNFELQAAATENSLILSLSSSHSFPLEEVARYLNAATVRHTLIQALLDAPLFEIRWRWNATRSLAIQRNRSGKRVPPLLQRMQAEDLIAQVFPDQIACAENLGGEREIPDHPLVNQVVRDCLTEAMDVEALEELIGKLEKGEVRIVAKDLREPSLFAQEILHARPYAFLDGNTEVAERRANAVKNRGWLDPAEASELSRLDPAAIARVKKEAWPEAQNFDELHDALLIHGFVTQEEGMRCGWGGFFDELLAQRRAARLTAGGGRKLWIAAENRPKFDTASGRKEIVRGRLEGLGPVTAAELARDFGLPEKEIQSALLDLEAEGFVFRGRFTPELGVEEWCERRLLQRIHRGTIETLRRAVQPASLQDFVRFLFARHGIGAEEERSGPEVLQQILGQLEGFEAPAAAWESELIPARMADYDPVWLDVLCLSGRIAWGRFHPPQDKEGKSGPVKSTPIAILPRGNVHLWSGLSGENRKATLNSGAVAQKILDDLMRHGASFFDDLARRTGLLPAQLEEGIAALVAAGRLTSDSFAGLRALLTPQENRRDKALLGIGEAGRWGILPSLPAQEELPYENLEQLALIYINRWGILFRSILEKETFAPPWRILVRVLRRMELRGELRGGRFVSHVSGEQFALPETVEGLRNISKQPKTGKLVSLSAADPLNLLGFILPGKRIPKLTGNRILFQDGVAAAALIGKETVYLHPFPEEKKWEAQKALARAHCPPKLLYYLGK